MLIQMAPMQGIPSGLSITNVIQIVLTLALIGLYVLMWKTQQRQADIQQTQSQIMSRQTALMAANHKPDLSEEGMKFNGDDVMVSLSNRGNGPAKNLHIECVLYFQGSEADSEKIEFLPAYRSVGTAVGPVTTRLERLPNDLEFEAPQDGPVNDIEDGELERWFMSEVKLSPMAVGSNSYSAPFSEVMQRLDREWKVDQFAMEFYVLYTDIANQIYGLWVSSYRNVPLEHGLNVQGAVMEGEECEQIGNVVPEGVQESALVLDPSDFNF